MKIEILILIIIGTFSLLFFILMFLELKKEGYIESKLGGK